MTEEELMPCPCGASAGVLPDNSYGFCVVACMVEDCGHSVPVVESVANLAQAKALWNKAARMDVGDATTRVKWTNEMVDNEFVRHADAIVDLQARVDAIEARLANG